MGQYDFTYEISDNFKKATIQFLMQNHNVDVAQAFQRVQYECDKVGFAYYAGSRE